MMNTEKRRSIAVFVLVGIVLAVFNSCTMDTSTHSSSSESGTPKGNPSSGSSSSSGGAAISFKASIGALWEYNSSAKIYYIIGLYYCGSPADTTYESMAIFVPAAYMNATANSDGTTYTCTINSSGTQGSYTAATAPIVMPVDTAGYSAQAALTSYSCAAATYTDKGFIYLYAGCRGRTHGAPTGVTDLKAAVRYYRYLQTSQTDSLPGDADRIFAFGHSGGGAQSAVFGSSGDSSLYTPYLTAIGAVTDSGYSDAICGAMCWCPITNLDQADGAYEWNMGLTRSSLSSADASISKGLASSFAAYINAVGFSDSSYNSGAALTLTETSDGYYQAGTYYDYVLSVINTSISNYNSDNSASVSSESSVAAFASSYKNAAKGLGAFDDYDGKSTAENTLMGIVGTAGHFDTKLQPLVDSYASSYSNSFTSDLAATDSVGTSVTTRLMMYTPLYYLVDNSTYYGGYGTSTPARYWRIRTGIDQTDTSLCTEVDLYLALKKLAAAGKISSVDFATVWGQGHTQAERTGSAATNFISWVEDCCE
jgi:hypothetical protein